MSIAREHQMTIGLEDLLVSHVAGAFQVNNKGIHCLGLAATIILLAMLSFLSFSRKPLTEELPAKLRESLIRWSGKGRSRVVLRYGYRTTLA